MLNTPSGPSDPSPKQAARNHDDASEDMQEQKYLDLQRQQVFRVSYLRKLSYEKVWVPAAQRPPTHQSLIIFDWDDTLLCTSYLSRNADRPLSPGVHKMLSRMANMVKVILEMSTTLGHTFIITNAMEGWVEYSAAKWVPELLPVLENMKIISARSRYECLYPGDVPKWKVNAFLDVQRHLNSEIITNLTSIGDSNYEMDATQVMGKQFSQALVKTVKLQEHPTPEELLKELELVESKFKQIVQAARNLKIGLERAIRQ
jgi:hypothetical protein